MHHKDAAYHNGAIWGWLSGAFVHVATKLGLHNFAYKHSKVLKNEILEGATPGTLSELFEPYSTNDIEISGTYSQAWSVSEFSRSFFQNYLGIRLDVPHRRLYITPSYPTELGNFQANIRYGFVESISVAIKAHKRNGSVEFIELKANEISKPIEVIIRLNVGYEENDTKTLLEKMDFQSRAQYKEVYLKVLLKSKNSQLKADFDFIDKNRIRLKDLFISNECELIAMGTDTISFIEKTDLNLTYASPISDADIDTMYHSEKTKHYLDKLILGDEFDETKRI